MRSQVASKEKQVNIEEEVSDNDDDDENVEEPGGDAQGSSSLQATRDLVTMWREAGRQVPQELTDEELQELAKLTTKSSRKKYLKYLAIKEHHKLARKRKQQLKKEEREAAKEQSGDRDNAEEEGPRNTFLLSFWQRSMDKLQGWRTAQAMTFGQPLVFDMSYDSNMSRQELENTASQLMEVEGWNRRAINPFHLHYCNLQPGGGYMKELLKRYGKEAWERLLVTTTERQHVDVFPREELVYLTADSPNILHNFDHSKVYIIGAIVDRSIQSGLSLANAKRLKLATARLPLDQYLDWGMGAKNLTLDQMIRIMMTLSETGNWQEALKFVPTRKHDGFHQQQTQSKMINDRVQGFKSRGERDFGDRWSTPGEKTFKQSGFTGRDRKAGLLSSRDRKPEGARVRTSFKNNMDGRKVAGKSKLWWDEWDGDTCNEWGNE